MRQFRVMPAVSKKWEPANSKNYPTHEQQKDVPEGEVDLTGRRFGKLVVESFWGMFTHQGRNGRTYTDPFWNCVCDCGLRHFKTKFTTNQLTKYHYRHCATAGCKAPSNPHV